MIVERWPVTNANPPVTIKQVAPATSQRRNKAMTMAPFRGSAATQVSRVSKDSELTLQRHPFAPAGSNRHQSMIAQPINYNGRRIAIPEECEILQKTQIARP